jgi:hypothetical protein
MGPKDIRDSIEDRISTRDYDGKPLNCAAAQYVHVKRKEIEQLVKASYVSEECNGTPVQVTIRRPDSTKTLLFSRQRSCRC